MSTTLALPRTLDVYDILTTLAPLATSYLGIGVQEGECVAHVVQANPMIDLTLCDTWGPLYGGTNRGSHDHIEAKLKSLGHRGSRTYLDGPSQSLVPQLTQHVDLSFVDGAHDTDSALFDLRYAWPLTNLAMVVHDLALESVRAAVALFLVVTFARVERFDGGHGTLVVWR